MTATLQLQLDEILTPEEGRELLEFCRRENKPLERVLYEAAKSVLSSQKPKVPSGRKKQAKNAA